MSKETNKTDKNTIIEVKDVNFYYDRTNQALNDISLDIKEKSVTAFIGPSGCGKTTFLGLINRLNDTIPRTKFEGTINFLDKNIYDKKYDVVKLRTDIGMLFQKPSPFPMSIYDNVVYGPKNQGVRKQAELDAIVVDSLKRAALWEEVKHKLREPALSLSGGQQQRLCIARAIAMRPKILLMDEPTSALDPISTKKIEELIRDLKKILQLLLLLTQCSKLQEWRIIQRFS